MPGFPNICVHRIPFSSNTSRTEDSTEGTLGNLLRGIEMHPCPFSRCIVRGPENLKDLLKVLSNHTELWPCPHYTMTRGHAAILSPPCPMFLSRTGSLFGARQGSPTSGVFVPHMCWLDFK